MDVFPKILYLNSSMLKICNIKDSFLYYYLIYFNFKYIYWTIFISNIYIYNRTVKNIEIKNFILKEIGKLTKLEEL